MRKLISFASITLLSLFPGDALYAESALEQLIEQTGIEAGAVAVRDRSGWRTPRKIIVRDLGGLSEGIGSTATGIDWVFVQSEAEALRHAADADAIIGFCSEALLAAAPAL
ncbi:MAG: hypothetical protein OEM60_05660, partial [Gammaproteobacteria bacterium]|nr:hypothetical protein [Gammaproteobacteria bacterium]